MLRRSRGEMKPEILASLVKNGMALLRQTKPIEALPGAPRPLRTKWERRRKLSKRGR